MAEILLLPGWPGADSTPPWPGGHVAGGVQVVGAGVNLRGAIPSLPPVFPELASALHLSSLKVALLAAAPVLCFAVFAGPAAPLSRPFGEERVPLASLVLV